MPWNDGAWWPIYVPQWWSPIVSRHPLDPYSFVHLQTGVICFYICGYPLWHFLGGTAAVSLTPLLDVQNLTVGNHKDYWSYTDDVLPQKRRRSWEKSVLLRFEAKTSSVSFYKIITLSTAEIYLFLIETYHCCCSCTTRCTTWFRIVVPLGWVCYHVCFVLHIWNYRESSMYHWQVPWE